MNSPRRPSSETRHARVRLLAILVLALIIVTSLAAIAQGPIIGPLPKMPTRTVFDHFDGAIALRAPTWTWIGEDPTSWGFVSETFLRLSITRDAGWICGQNAHQNTLLLRDPIPNGRDFVIETMVIFDPQSNYQVANLVVHQDDGNFVVLGRAFCAPGTGTPPAVCVGDGIYFDCEVGDCCFCRSGFPTAVPLFGAARALSTPVSVPVWLRITRSGNDYKGYYSLNARDWVLVGTHNANLSNVRVGLAVGTGGTGNLGPSADFDYFSLVQY